MHAVKAWPLPEIVDDALEVSRDQHDQGDDGGEDEGWRRSQSADVSHRQDARLQIRKPRQRESCGTAVSF